jgi:hypothetical protein
MYKKTIFSVFAGIALTAAGAVTANANTINGSFSISGAFTPFLNGAESSLLDANELDFNDGTINPGTPGTITVTGTTGDFSGLLNTGDTGTIQDLSFLGTPTTGFQAPVINGFEIIGPVTVNLLTISVLQQTDAFLSLHGGTTINATGFEQTNGAFSFVGPTNVGSANALVAQQSSFSFSAGNVAAAVPEPAMLMLCGLGLMMLAVFRRKRSRHE